jgi:hypothetical protein
MSGASGLNSGGEADDLGSQLKGNDDDSQHIPSVHGAIVEGPWRRQGRNDLICPRRLGSSKGIREEIG